MSNLNTLELKAFVPARDFSRSQAFYRTLGFQMLWTDNDLACFRLGSCSFLLQNFYAQELAENLTMHLLVEDVEAWWRRVQRCAVAESFGVRLLAPQDQPWRMRDFVIDDPSGVLWRIAQHI